MPSSKKTVVIIGNSVGLRVRPTNKAGLTYSQILKNELNYTILNRCFGRATSIEVLENTDQYIREFADFYIINLGCVDAPNREIPLWFSDVLYGRRKSLFNQILKGIYQFIIAPERSRFAKWRNKSWVSEKYFKKNMYNIVSRLKKDTQGKIILLGINKGTSRIEEALPGTLKKYQLYNDLIRNVAMLKDTLYIDPNEFLEINHFPDGVHYNKEGHEIIAKEIINCIISGK